MRYRNWLALVLFGAGVSVASAEDGKAPWEEFENRLKTSQTISALGDDLMGDSISLADGGLSFSATDIDIPGNTGLAVAFGRRYTVFNHWKYENTGSPLGDWELDVPSISGVFAPNWTIGDPYLDSESGSRCSVRKLPTQPLRDYTARDFWHGNILSIPGVAGGELLSPNGNAMPTSGGPYPWITADNVRVSCLSSIKNGTGEGFLAVTPDGTKYWFDWMAQYKEPTLAMVGRRSPSGFRDDNPVQRRKNVLYATKVEDRFGHTVEYRYTNAWNAPAVLEEIVGSDGREITLAYENGRVKSASAGTRAWSYMYGSTPEGRYTLTQVKLPDSSKWKIEFAELTDAYMEYRVGSQMEPARDCMNTDPPLNYADEPVGTITHPSGAIGAFRMGIRKHGRSNVPIACKNVTTTPSGSTPGLNNDPTDDMNSYVIDYDSLTILRKSISGPAVSARTWDYSYEPGVSFYFTSGATRQYPVCHPWTLAECIEPRCVSESCAGSSRTTVTESGGRWSRYTFGNSYRYNEGKLLRTERGSDASHILRTDTNRYDFSLTDQAYPAKVGGSLRATDEAFASVYTRPLLGKTVLQQGATFNWDVATGCPIGSHCFDRFARPLEVIKASSLGYSKVETTEYHDDTSLWVVGQIARTTTDGIVTGRTDYGWMGLPWKVYSFGSALRTTFGYNTTDGPQKGTIATVKDGNDNTTTVSEWKRGIPRLISYPATSDEPTGSVQSAVVDDNGWILSVNDENNYKTCYHYDPMGRLDQIIYPSESALNTCNNSKWAITTRVFEPTSSSDEDYGIPGGHWKQTVITGDARAVTYYDALWRPIVEERFDTQDAATTSFVVSHYDAAGRQEFQSYPLSSLSNYATVTAGTTTQYDALDRVKTVSVPSIDSATGSFATSTTYIESASGPYVRVTDQNGNQTRTWFQMFDQPDYSRAVKINHPEGSYTTIERDVFGKPTLLKRADGNEYGPERRFYYDAYQQLCRSREPETGSTVLNYDAAGNLTWSAAGLALPADSPCYNAQGMQSGRRVDRTYDARNRLKTLAFPDGNGDQTWFYEPDGLASQIVTDNDDGATLVVNAYSYNHRRLLAGESMAQPGYTWSLGYGYNGNGHVAVSLTQPGGEVVNFAPNALGQATQAVSPYDNYATGVTYWPNGGIRQFTYGNGVVHRSEQNDRQLPSRSVDFYGSSYRVIDDNYRYDGNGNVTDIIDMRFNSGGQGDRVLTYDGLDRLKKATSKMFGNTGALAQVGYAYDAADNLTRVSVPATALAPARNHYYCYDATWRLTNVMRESCTGSTVMGLGYDVQGNLENKSGQHYVFDFGNRLRKVVDKEAYRYDGQGRRVMASSLQSGGDIRSMYGHDGVLRYQRDDKRSRVINYIYLGGSLLASRETPYGTASHEVRYQHTDALGSPVAVTNGSRVIVELSEYEPYGKLLNRPLGDGPGYTGHASDAATGLVYMQQRYYDPMIGRFLSVDPVTAYSDPVRMFNRYKYAANNPYSFKDPDGRQECRSCEMSYGAAVGYMLRDNPEAMRVWRGGEEAAGTAGSGAEVGAEMGEAIGEFVDAGDFSREAVEGVAVKFAMAAATRGKGKGKGGGAEHTKGARPSTKGKHEEGQARKQRDRGGERGDSGRRPPRKPPPDHKGPWPPTPPPPPDDKKRR